MTQVLSEELKANALNVCMNIAASHESQIIAACFYGPRVCGYADEKSDVHVLLVLGKYQPRIVGYLKPLGAIKAFILAVERGAFEKDIERGWLGEFVAEKLTVPYEPIINEEYLRSQEVRLKRRIVYELLENIVLESPELSHELLIRAEYFMYEAMTRRARLFPPVTYTFLNMLRRGLRKRNTQLMMDGYQKALNELARENQITFTNEHVRITENLIKAIRSRKLRIPTFLKSFQRAAFLNILSIFPKMMTPFMQDEEIFVRSHRGVEAEELVFQLEDPKNYLLIPTPHGPVPLSDTTTIEDFVRKTIPDEKVSNIEIEEMGGALNSVYLLTLRRNHEEQRVVVKRFKDWLGFKWFPLALWALGTQRFAVLGQSRLEKEYAITQFLHTQGLPVPEILSVSPKERLIFKEFVEGEKLVEVIKRIISSRKGAIAEIALVKEVGKKISEAHRLGVSLGDCKPENIIVTKDGKPYFVDLEQAARNGNQAWDVAEFLYYSGHYVSPVSPADAAELITKEFIEGYIEAGGKKETIRKAGSPRYTKVFSIFTSPHVLLAISNVCKKIDKNEEKGLVPQFS